MTGDMRNWGEDIRRETKQFEDWLKAHTSEIGELRAEVAALKAENAALRIRIEVLEGKEGK
jgi:septal ring factor EnvC (AmiA/AmiB activator)